MKKRRWLVSLAALLVLAAAGGGIAWTLAGRGSRTAAETLEAYTEALNQREYGTMYRLLDEESRRETDEETLRKETERSMRESKRRISRWRFSVREMRTEPAEEPRRV